MNAALESASPLPPETNGCNNASAAQTVPRSLLVILRVYLGVILFITVLGKLTRDNPFATEMLRFLRGVATRRASAPYLHFVQSVGRNVRFGKLGLLASARETHWEVPDPPGF